MNIGQFNHLKVERLTAPGAYLSDETGTEVLLPKRYVPEGCAVGDRLRVFVYTDSDDRPIATTETPKIVANNMAWLSVKEVSSIGAFFDIGLAKDLLVPMGKQHKPLAPGQVCLVWAYLDQSSQRLVGTTRISNTLSHHPLDLETGQEVKAEVWDETPVGWRVVVNDEYDGMLYKNQVFKTVQVQMVLKAYVQQIRPDGKLDLLMQPLGAGSIEPAANEILEALRKAGGTLALSDSSRPEEIEAVLGLSKKSFKKALGTLYKLRLVELADKEVRITPLGAAQTTGD